MTEPMSFSKLYLIIRFHILSPAQGHLRSIKLCHKSIHISEFFSYVNSQVKLDLSSQQQCSCKCSTLGETTLKSSAHAHLKVWTEQFVRFVFIDPVQFRLGQREDQKFSWLSQVASAVSGYCIGRGYLMHEECVEPKVQHLLLQTVSHNHIHEQHD